jgi:uncharacterized membrane protein YbhN (UPF0104 family)
LLQLAVVGALIGVFVVTGPGIGSLRDRIAHAAAGWLGGNLPIPGGFGGLDAGLIGTFALYHQPLAATSAAVLLYHRISLWVPALIGSVAFVQLRGTREA